MNTKKSLWAVRVWAVYLTRESDIEAVCFPAFDGNLQIFVKARDCEEVGIYILKTV
jgi:hypothetical protein